MDNESIALGLRNTYSNSDWRPLEQSGWKMLEKSHWIRPCSAPMESEPQCFRFVHCHLEQVHFVADAVAVWACRRASRLNQRTWHCPRYKPPGIYRENHEITTQLLNFFVKSTYRLMANSASSQLGHIKWKIL